VQLGSLDPLDTYTGQAQRLANLGFGRDVTGEDAAEFARALGEFQRSEEMTPTGRMDDATLEKLKQAHGG
jgi:hypothetical protein